MRSLRYATAAGAVLALAAGIGRAQGLMGSADAFPTGVPTTPGPAFGPNAPAAGAAVRGGGEEPTIRLPSPVLTIDWEALFEGTEWGKRIEASLASATEAQRRENDQIADQLIDEEKALTEKRGKIDATEFRTEADAFDARATEIRNTQNAKAEALARRYEGARQAFFAAMGPMLDEVLRRRGAVAVLDQRAVIRALPEADVTQDLMALVDARMGSGPKLPEATPGEAAAPTPGGVDAARPAPDASDLPHGAFAPLTAPSAAGSSGEAAGHAEPDRPSGTSNAPQNVPLSAPTPP